MGQTTSVDVKQPGAPPIVLPTPATHPSGITDPHTTKEGTMKAWVVTGPKTDPIFTVTPIPEPVGDFVRVRVASAALNPSDLESRGVYPAVLGTDGAGIVDAVAPGLQQEGTPLIGQRVVFRVDGRGGLGSFAEYTLVARSALVPIPPTVTFTDAAALPTSAWAAYIALFTKLRVESGRSIYISGGAGGVGGFAIQFALLSKLNVITSCSTYNVSHLESRGVHAVIDYTNKEVAAEVLRITQGHGVDYVLDTLDSPTRPMEPYYRMMKPGGHICCTNPIPTIRAPGPNDPFTQGLSFHYVQLDAMHTTPEIRQLVVDVVGATVVAMVASGTLKSNLGELCSMDMISQALKSLAQRHARGKLVATIMKKEKPQQQQPQVAVNPTDTQQQPSSAIVQIPPAATATTTSAPPITSQPVLSVPASSNVAPPPTTTPQLQQQQQPGHVTQQANAPMYVYRQI